MSLNHGRNKRKQAITCGNCEFSLAFTDRRCQQCLRKPMKQRRQPRARRQQHVIDLCSTGDEDGDIVIERVVPPAATPSVASPCTDDAQDLLDAATALHNMSFGELPPLSEQDQQFMKTVMEDFLSDMNDEPALSSPKRPHSVEKKNKSMQRMVCTVSKSQKQVLIKSWKPARPEPVSVDDEDEDAVTECLSDVELSEIAAESEDEEDDFDECGKDELLEFVRNIPSEHISPRQQRLVRASLMSWRFDCL